MRPILSATAACAAGLIIATASVKASGALRTVHRTGTDDAATVDPHRVGFPGETTIMSDLFVGLTTLDAQTRVIPGCAASWKISPDGRTYTFALRRGLKWSDGSPLTAADFDYSIRRALLPATAFPFAGRLFMIRNAREVATGRARPSALGVRLLGVDAIEIVLDFPAPYFTEVLASYAMPVPRERVERLGESWVRSESFITNGPFMLAEWRPNAFIRLRKNPHFYDASSVAADEVMHYPVAQPMTALRRFRSGEVDFVLSVPPDQLPWAREQFGDQLKIDQALGLEALAFNAKHGATRDVRVRRALSMAIDREALARNVLGDAQLAAFGYVPRGAANYPQRVNADFAAWPVEQRHAEARRLLAAAGYSNARPLALRLGFPANDGNRRIAVVIAAMWRAVGVRAELQAREQRALVADVRRGDFDAVRVLWLAGHSDATAFLERFDSGAVGGAVNQSGYANPRFDELLARAQRQSDLVLRAAILREAESLALADHPVAPIYFFVSRRLVSSRLAGWAHNPRGIHLSRFMSVPPR